MRSISKLATMLVVSFVFAQNISAATQDQGAIQQAAPNPVKDVTPYVEKDKASVIAFFKFNCPACRMYHYSLAEWGKSIPKGIDFQFNPVIEAGGGRQISEESMLVLQAFWVSERLGNASNRAIFAEEAYSLSQDEGLGADKDRWFSALNAQFKTRDIVNAWKAEISLGDARCQRQLHYNPTSTPTLVICGKWMISPESTHGDQTLFAQLANGLVSRCADDLNLKIERNR